MDEGNGHTTATCEDVSTLTTLAWDAAWKPLGIVDATGHAPHTPSWVRLEY